MKKVLERRYAVAAGSFGIRPGSDSGHDRCGQGPTGALVPNVKVSAISTDTNLSRQVVTDESGTFRIAALNPGPYRLEAEASGFKKSTIDGIVLEVGQHRASMSMQRSETSPKPSKSPGASVVNTESNLIGGVINQSRVISLPLNGRNFCGIDHADRGHR
jgi:hypothetical protein